MFSGAGKFCLTHGLRRLTRDVKSDVRTLNFISDVIFNRHKNTELRSENVDMRRKMSKMKEMTTDK